MRSRTATSSSIAPSQMPNRTGHLAQARANRAHAQWLMQTNATDATVRQWAVIAAFHCAVHCIAAYLNRYGRSSSSHEERKALVRRNGLLAVPKPVWDAYAYLDRS